MYSTVRTHCTSLYSLLSLQSVGGGGCWRNITPLADHHEQGQDNDDPCHHALARRIQTGPLTLRDELRRLALQSHLQNKWRTSLYWDATQHQCQLQGHQLSACLWIPSLCPWIFNQEKDKLHPEMEQTSQNEPSFSNCPKCFSLLKTHSTHITLYESCFHAFPSG